MSWMYQALLHLQQRPRAAARRTDPPVAGAHASVATSVAPALASRDSAEASQAAQGALERATRLLEAHHALPEPLAVPPAETFIPADASPKPCQPPPAAAIAASSFTPPASESALPGDVVQHLIRRLSDPLQAAPLQTLAQRLAGDRRATGCRSQWLVAIGSSQGVEDVGLGVAACLAASKELSGGDVLLVDADLARRRLSEALGWDDQPGLVECLLSPRPPRSLCRPIGLAHLWVLPAGQMAGERLMESVAAGTPGAMGWAELVASFGAVLLCGGSTDDPWAGALAQLADATYVGVELGRIDEPTARAAVSRLRQQGARVLGCLAIGG
jgi:Mrp family chromosome partitioning ATPase